MSSDSESCGDASPALQSAARTLYYLLDLATFFDLASAGQWQAALDHMDRLGLLPSTATSEEIDAKVAGFAALSDLVRRPIPAALLQLMRCITAKASTAKANEYGTFVSLAFWTIYVLAVDLVSQVTFP